MNDKDYDRFHDEIQRIVRLSSKEIDRIENVVVSEDATDFAILNTVNKILGEKGFNVGVLCGDDPIGFSKSVSSISKWRNIESEDYSRLDGFAMSECFRKAKTAIIVYFV